MLNDRDREFLLKVASLPVQTDARGMVFRPMKERDDALTAAYLALQDEAERIREAATATPETQPRGLSVNSGPVD